MSGKPKDNQYSEAKNLAYMQGNYGALLNFGVTLLSFAGALLLTSISMNASVLASETDNADLINQFSDLLDLSALLYGIFGAIATAAGFLLNWYRFKFQNNPERNVVLSANDMAKGNYLIIIEGSMQNEAIAGCAFKEVIQNACNELKQRGHEIKKISIASDLGIKEL